MQELVKPIVRSNVSYDHPPYLFQQQRTKRKAFCLSFHQSFTINSVENQLVQHIGRAYVWRVVHLFGEKNEVLYQDSQPHRSPQDEG